MTGNSVPAEGTVYLVCATWHSADSDYYPTEDAEVLYDWGYFTDEAEAEAEAAMLDRAVREEAGPAYQRYITGVSAKYREQQREVREHNALVAAGLRKRPMDPPLHTPAMTLDEWYLSQTERTTHEVIAVAPRTA